MSTEKLTLNIIIAYHRERADHYAPFGAHNIVTEFHREATVLLEQLAEQIARPPSVTPSVAPRMTPSVFQLGDRVRKVRGSQWHGHVVGGYSTKLTPEGYAVESINEPGSVQIYPASALELWTK